MLCHREVGGGEGRGTGGGLAEAGHSSLAEIFCSTAPPKNSNCRGSNDSTKSVKIPDHGQIITFWYQITLFGIPPPPPPPPHSPSSCLQRILMCMTTGILKQNSKLLDHVGACNGAGQTILNTLQQGG